MAVESVMDHGAVGDGETLDTAAIQAAIDACAAGGGGRVVLPAGKVFLAGSFELRGCIELYVERGARLIASLRREDYASPAFIEGEEREKLVWIRAHEADDVALTGGGVIDGRCQGFYQDGTLVRWRPAMTCFVACRRLRVHDITLTNAANWTLHFTGCRDVAVYAVTIDNPLDFPNCDGIDPDHCRDVRISDCAISCADDCIVLKNTRSYAAYGPTENVTVTNCTLVSTSCAIKVGSESVSDFRDCVFSNCVIKGSNRGIGLQLRDEADMEHMLFSNMIIETRLFPGRWWGVGEPIYVTALPRNPQTTPGQIRDVRFRNIIARGENGVYLQGCPQSRPENVEFVDVRVRIAKTTEHPAGLQDPRPCTMEAFAGRETVGDPTPWGQKIRGGNPGFHIAYAGRVVLRDCAVEWSGESDPAYTHALSASDVRRLERSGFRGQAAHEGLNAEVLDGGPSGLRR